MRRPRLLGRLAVIALAATALAGAAFAQEVNCANEFRSGKLDFQEFQKSKQQNRTEEARKLLERTLGNFRVAVETCPEKAEYRWRYAIALAEAGNFSFEDAAFAVDDAAREEAHLRAMEYFTLAGAEFEAVKDAEEGTKGKNRKAVRENRGHYWVDHYNEAIELLEDENFQEAAIQFEVCRLLNPIDQRAYIQGAIAHISLDEREKALELVQTGRVQPAEDWTGEEYKIEENVDRFASLERNIYRGRARDNADAAVAGKDQALLQGALSDYDQLIEWTPDDPNLYFERGMTRLSGGNLLEGEAASTMYREAAADFDTVTTMIEADTENFDANLNFYGDAMFNQIQAYERAKQPEQALATTRAYICTFPTDRAGWQILAALLQQMEQPEEAVEALLMSKCLAEDPIELSAAKSILTGDAKAALGELGDPDLVHSYQASNGDQVTALIWQGKNLARLYVLGELNSEVTWCN